MTSNAVKRVSQAWKLQQQTTDKCEMGFHLKALHFRSGKLTFFFSLFQFVSSAEEEEKRGNVLAFFGDSFAWTNFSFLGHHGSSRLLLGDTSSPIWCNKIIVFSCHKPTAWNQIAEQEIQITRDWIRPPTADTIVSESEVLMPRGEKKNTLNLLPTNLIGI